MPLEIRELVIKVTVNESRDSRIDETTLAKKLEELEKKIINKCLNKINDRIENLHER